MTAFIVSLESKWRISAISLARQLRQKPFSNRAKKIEMLDQRSNCIHVLKTLLKLCCTFTDLGHPSEFQPHNLDQQVSPIEDTEHSVHMFRQAGITPQKHFSLRHSAGIVQVFFVYLLRCLYGNIFKISHTLVTATWLIEVLFLKLVPRFYQSKTLTLFIT